MLSYELDTNTITNDLVLLLEFVVIRLQKSGETELSGEEDLLSAWELELCSSKGFSGLWNITWLNSHGHENLTNVYSCGLAKGFTESTSHTLLESICTSTRKHLVNSNNMPWMDSDSHMEIFFS